MFIVLLWHLLLLFNGLMSSACICALSILKDTTFHTVRHNYAGPPSFKRHNLVNIRFIYMKVSGTIAEGMLSLKSETN